MSDNFSLIIKNGSCYIDGKLTTTDIGLSGNKIKKIGHHTTKKKIIISNILTKPLPTQLMCL